MVLSGRGQGESGCHKPRSGSLWDFSAKLSIIFECISKAKQSKFKKMKKNKEKKTKNNH